ncbi:hypothetical protein [Bradyrhizobium sp. CCGUVB14]|uniref:hypothetical protein n=1 Tax=Bradyrhizobium sp. CCGUVB14 TaxID=2949628 RepID=UPI0020B20626|nr:hypothetical protein [Bradyrhizobium sp. CCGUVB14]MCP3441251.1 hypothetical protein [Bradyrhizobium sp. CCGUVB14]
MWQIVSARGNLGACEAVWIAAHSPWTTGLPTQRHFYALILSQDGHDSFNERTFDAARANALVPYSSRCPSAKASGPSAFVNEFDIRPSTPLSEFPYASNTADAFIVSNVQAYNLSQRQNQADSSKVNVAQQLQQFALALL